MGNFVSRFGQDMWTASGSTVMNKPLGIRINQSFVLFGFPRWVSSNLWSRRLECAVHSQSASGVADNQKNQRKSTERRFASDGGGKSGSSMYAIRIFTHAVLVAGLMSLSGQAQSLPPEPTKNPEAGIAPDGSFVVATAQRLRPSGQQIEFFGRPTDLALNSDESILAVKNSHGLVFIDRKSRAIQQELRLPRIGFEHPLHLGGGGFTGIIWDSTGRKVWTTDSYGGVHCATLQTSGLFKWTQSIHLPGVGEPDSVRVLSPQAPRINGSPPAFVPSSPGRMSFDREQKYLYVALSRNNSVGAVNLEHGRVEFEISVGTAPYGILIHGTRAFVTNWGGRRPRLGDSVGTTAGSPIVIDSLTGVASSGTVSVLDLEKRTVVSEIAVGLHPGAMCLSHDGRLLFVANANSDSVSVIDTGGNAVVQTLNVRGDSTAPFGSMPDALSLSADGRFLYVANGGDNTVLVYDLKTNRPSASIPVGWFPGAVIVSEKWSELYVANVKGFGSLGADRKFQFLVEEDRKAGKNAYDYSGSVSVIPLAPDGSVSAAAVAGFNERLWDGQPPNPPNGPVPIPSGPGQMSVFHHVLYIIKENHSYDEILGDVHGANGDPKLCMFCKDVTPNHHALAQEFTTFDNFYVNGVLSADGHQWTDEGLTTDYVEKSMSGFSRSYPSDGTDPLAYSAAGFIWNAVLRKGLSFRDYGEFLKSEVTFQPATAKWADFYGDYSKGTRTVSFGQHTELKSLEKFVSPTYPTFTLTIPDVYRAKEFVREFEQFEKQDNLPNFMIMLLGNDHTSGTDEGYPTPRAAVADNDLALGQIIEAVSKSKYWKDTVVFVVEDDAQDGLDHVDGRRTVAYAVSAYTRRKAVDRTFYNQNSILRSIELIFGLPPMTKFDLLARPLWNAFQQNADLRPYTAKANLVPLTEMNPAISSLRGKQREWAEKSMAMDFSAPDRADEDTLNRILWYSVKGYRTKYPRRPQRSVGADDSE
jgi:YVTN family beta-propeller protein